MKSILGKILFGVALIGGAILINGSRECEGAGTVVFDESDEALAKSPIIVVGKWNKAPLRPHERVEDHPTMGKVGTASEGHTELVVERVITGDIKPGTHKLLLGFRLGWPNKDGGPLMRFTSSEQMGDVNDVAESNLWFLVRKRSWDKADTHTYLGLETCRGAQPLVLEAYFRALASKNPTQEVPKLLTAEEPVVIFRVLKFIVGGTHSWPYEKDIIPPNRKVNRKRDPMLQYVADVEKLLSRKQPDTRRLAAVAYADLAGKAAIPRMRQLLGDADGIVRGVAVGTLVRHDDRAFGDAICRAVRDIRDGWVACRVIELLSKWKAPHAVPALIEFLQNIGVKAWIGNVVLNFDPKH